MIVIPVKTPFFAMLLAAAFAAAVSTTPLLAQEQKDVEAAKAKYLREVRASGEAARLDYVHTLLAMHNKLMKIVKSPQWTDAVDARFQAINEAMTLHPMPANSDAAKLSTLRLGKWRSPRHDYLYRKDGTWTMLPIESPETTHGKWKIKGNQSLEEGESYTIILLDDLDFIFAGKDGAVYYEWRIQK